MRLRKLDKKTERQASFARKQQVKAAVRSEANPTRLLHATLEALAAQVPAAARRAAARALPRASPLL